MANGTKQSSEETKFQAGELMERERVSVEPRVNGKRQEITRAWRARVKGLASGAHMRKSFSVLCTECLKGNKSCMFKSRAAIPSTAIILILVLMMTQHDKILCHAILVETGVTE